MVRRILLLEEFLSSLAERTVRSGRAKVPATRLEAGLVCVICGTAILRLAPTPPPRVSRWCELHAQENGVMIRGQIDVLVLKDQFLILVIESKRAKFSLKTGIPQALTYMLANPEPTQPLYGMVTNGSHFVFLKLMHDDVPRYARSQEFRLEEENELGQVLQVLKRLAGAIARN